MHAFKLPICKQQLSHEQPGGQLAKCSFSEVHVRPADDSGVLGLWLGLGAAPGSVPTEDIDKTLHELDVLHEHTLLAFVGGADETICTPGLLAPAAAVEVSWTTSFIADGDEEKRVLQPLTTEPHNHTCRHTRMTQHPL